MSNCIVCGAELKEGSKSCLRCGVPPFGEIVSRVGTENEFVVQYRVAGALYKIKGIKSEGIYNTRKVE